MPRAHRLLRCSVPVPVLRCSPVLRADRMSCSAGATALSRPTHQTASCQTTSTPPSHPNAPPPSHPDAPPMTWQASSRTTSTPPSCRPRRPRLSPVRGKPPARSPDSMRATSPLWPEMPCTGQAPRPPRAASHTAHQLVDRCARATSSTAILRSQLARQRPTPASASHRRVGKDRAARSSARRRAPRALPSALPPRYALCADVPSSAACSWGSSRLSSRPSRRVRRSRRRWWPLPTRRPRTRARRREHCGSSAERRRPLPRSTTGRGRRHSSGVEGGVAPRSAATCPRRGTGPRLATQGWRDGLGGPAPPRTTHHPDGSRDGFSTTFQPTQPSGPGV
jgi:hypothetical protein